jgi:uncharacterized protein (DUF1697 family)
MAALRDSLTVAGMTDVRTYIQSGNIVAGSPLRTHAQVSGLVRTVIATDFSVDLPVITRRAAEIDTCQVIGNHVYVDYVHGYHNTHRTAPWFTRVLGVDGTERNWRTVLALAALLGQAPSTAASKKAC